MSEPEVCGDIHTSPTASGDLEVRCAKMPGHVGQGDDQHEAWVQKVFPVRWRDEPVSG